MPAKDIEITAETDVDTVEDTPTRMVVSRSELLGKPDAELDEGTPTRMNAPKDLAWTKGKSVPTPEEATLDDLADDDEPDEPTRLVTRGPIAALPQLPKLPSLPASPPRARPPSAPPPAPRSFPQPALAAPKLPRFDQAAMPQYPVSAPSHPRGTPLPMMRQRHDTTPRFRAEPTSFPPVALGDAPPSLARRPARKSALGAAAVLLGALVASVAVFSSSGENGTLIVSVSGPANQPVEGVEVIADDVSRCESAPCRIEDLAEGTHFIKVSAKGYPATAARAIAVRGGNDNTIHIELSRLAPEPAATVSEAPGTKEPEATPRTFSIADFAKQDGELAAPALRAAPRPSMARAAAAMMPAAPAPEPKPAAVSKGSLNINSIPAANVVVDGRPVGRTPVLGLSVSAGAHTVVFVHPEKGRAVKTATVEAGETSAVLARF